MSEKTKLYELTAKFDSAVSFYGKAKVVESENTYVLYSYDTKVMVLYKDEAGLLHIYLNDCVDDDLLFSNTTLRHMIELLRQVSGVKYNKKAILREAVMVNMGDVGCKILQGKMNAKPNDMSVVFEC